MKVILIFFAASIFQAQANVGFTQSTSLSLNANNKTLKEVLSSIEKQSNYYFTYNQGLLDLSKSVSITTENKQLKEVLDELFKNESIGYTIKGKHIILFREGKDKQQGDVTGTVVDSSGEPLIGVSVAIEGTTLGTFTDIDGKYSLKVSSSEAVLSFSYIGYKAKKQVQQAGSDLRITLEDDAQVIEEVVVTALGLKREAKSLTYNVQEIKSGDITLVKDVSFINSLAGKVAGVQINTSASGVGGSTRVVMRGNKSLSGENGALYVIDGIPMPSLKTGQPENTYENGSDNGDFDGISNINSDDIESISVLTGAAAAALYGSQGANGVILVTTKRGHEGKLKVAFSNSSSFMSPFVMPKFQNTYGQIEKGKSVDSWGAKLETPSSYDPKDFFQTGYSITNGLSFSVGTAKNQTYGSFSAVNARGIIPTNDYDRYNFSIRNSSELIDKKLFLDLSAFYMKQQDVNSKTQGRFHNPILSIYLFPPGDEMEKYKVYKKYNAERSFQTQFWEYGGGNEQMQNPYWIVNEEEFLNKRDRYMFNMTLKYDILDWMSLTGRAKIDHLSATAERKLGASTSLLFASPYGNYLQANYNNRNIYADAILNIDKRFDTYGIVANIGTSIQDTDYELTSYEGHLTLANYFHYNGIANTGTEHGGSTEAWQDKYHDQLQALFGTLQLNYNSLVFLDLTGRIDWPSALAFSKKTSFSYGSVGLSGVISDMIDLSPAKVSFMKARLSYAEVGNYPKRFIGKTSYPTANGSLNTMSYRSAEHLTPERTKAWEAGVNLKFFGTKFGIDATVYKSNTYNQLFEQNLTPTSGYTLQYINAGNVENKGIELGVNFKQKIGKVNWMSNFTYTLNKNRIVELIPEGTIDPTTGKPMDTGVESMEVGTVTPEGYRMMLTKGGSVGDIYVTGLKVDHHGYVKVDPYTGTVASDKQTLIFAGNASPKYNLGFRNSFSYKGFDFSFLLDARVGGVVVSATEMVMSKYGVSETTGKERDAGGTLVNGKLVNTESYYKEVGHSTLAPFVYSATNVRLREAALTYTFPSKLFKDKLESIQLSLTARNLWMIYNKAPHDPELTASTGTYFQGYDYFMQPSLRSLGFGLKVVF